MSETKFTKGPWAKYCVHGHKHALIRTQEACEKGGAPIAEMREGSTEADANLIAAAPDLYEALEFLLSEIESTINIVWCEDTEDAIIAAQAALAKARGEE